MQVPSYNTPAILLRRLNYGDYDLILTFLSRRRGKIATLAKYARKSKRRFAGVLELFSACDLVCAPGRNPQLPILKEASLENPFAGIRSSILKTAYASYWVELADLWLDRESPQAALHDLLYQVLDALDRNTVNPDILSLLYLLHFLHLAGLQPLLHCCTACGCGLEHTCREQPLIFASRRGGLVCPVCADQASEGSKRLSQGVINPLRWLARSNVLNAGRIRIAPPIRDEALLLLETFVTDHLGRMPRSLPVLKNLRKTYHG